jgi:hypothetical protein
VYNPPSPDVVHASDSQEAVLNDANAPGVAPGVAPPTFATYYPTTSPVDYEAMTAQDFSTLDYYAAQHAAQPAAQHAAQPAVVPAPLPRARTVSPVQAAPAVYAPPASAQQAFAPDAVYPGHAPAQSLGQLPEQPSFSYQQQGQIPATTQVQFQTSFPTVQQSIAESSQRTQQNAFYTTSAPEDPGAMSKEVEEPVGTTGPREHKPSTVRVLVCLCCFLLLMILIVGVAVGVSVSKQTVTVTTT